MVPVKRLGRWSHLGVSKAEHDLALHASRAWDVQALHASKLVGGRVLRVFHERLATLEGMRVLAHHVSIRGLSFALLYPL